MLLTTEQIRRMRGGAQSHLMRCSDGNYYVVKFQNHPQHRILVNELLGTRLAARLGLLNPETGERRLRLIEDQDEYNRVRRLHPWADEALLRALRDDLENRLGYRRPH